VVCCSRGRIRRHCSGYNGRTRRGPVDRHIVDFRGAFSYGIK
jgi:hypothetical protein